MRMCTSALASALLVLSGPAHADLASVGVSIGGDKVVGADVSISGHSAAEASVSVGGRSGASADVSIGGGSRSTSGGSSGSGGGSDGGSLSTGGNSSGTGIGNRSGASVQASARGGGSTIGTVQAARGMSLYSSDGVRLGTILALEKAGSLTRVTLQVDPALGVGRAKMTFRTEITQQSRSQFMIGQRVRAFLSLF